MAPLVIPPNDITNNPLQRWVLPALLNPYHPSSPFYIDVPMLRLLPSPSPPLPPPPPEWNATKTLAICAIAYVGLCNAGVAITMTYWNKDRRPHPRSLSLAFQWSAFFALWAVALPVVPVLFSLQLLVRAFLYWRYSLPASAEDLEGQELERHIDALDTTIDGGRSRFHRALVAFVGAPPLRAGKLSWAAENRWRALRARQARRAERRARLQAFWTLPPYDGVVLPPYETVVVEPETVVGAADADDATSAAPGQGGGDGGFAEERVVGGCEASFSESQVGAATVRPPPPAYHG